jgi:hypothetical protein
MPLREVAPPKVVHALFAVAVAVVVDVAVFVAVVVVVTDACTRDVDDPDAPPHPAIKSTAATVPTRRLTRAMLGTGER